MPPWRRHGVVSLLDMEGLRLFALLHDVAALAKKAGDAASRPDAEYLRRIGLTPFAAEMKGIGPRLRVIGFHTSAEHADRIFDALVGEERISNHGVARMVEELVLRIEDEAKARVFLWLSRAEGELYENPTKDWDTVLQRFPAAEDDVYEMNKCFALGRYPASTYHSMQVIEHGLIEFGRWLQASDPKAGWNATTNELKRIVQLGHERRSDGERKHFPFIEQMHAVSTALMTAWRHKIDHAAGRLVLLPGALNEETARAIIGATNGFMLRLAADLPVGTISS